MAKILIIFLFVVQSFGTTNYKVTPFSELKLKDTIIQNYEESCGASAIATLLNIYDKNVTEEDILEKINTTDMISFLDIANIAKEYDFVSAGYKIDIETFNKLKVPVIARVVNRDNFAHFVVVTNYEGDFVSINDPNFGYYIDTKKEFFRWWNEDSKGYILIVLPKNISKLPNKKLQLPNKNLYNIFPFKLR